MEVLKESQAYCDKVKIIQDIMFKDADFGSNSYFQEKLIREREKYFAIASMFYDVYKIMMTGGIDENK